MTGWIMFSVFNSKQSVPCVIIKCFSFQNNVGISLLHFYNASTLFFPKSWRLYAASKSTKKGPFIQCMCVFVYTYT